MARRRLGRRPQGVRRVNVRIPGGAIEREEKKAARVEKQIERGTGGYSSVKQEHIPRYEDVYKQAPPLFSDAEGRLYFNVTLKDFPDLARHLASENGEKLPPALIVLLPRSLVLKGELGHFPAATDEYITVTHIESKKVVKIYPSKTIYPEAEKRSVGLVML